jgi:bacterioferritin-associated ferredoxin
MYVCLCRAVTDRDVNQAIAQGHQSLPALQATLGVATGCGRCRHHVCRMLQDETTDAALANSTAAFVTSAAGRIAG